MGQLSLVQYCLVQQGPTLTGSLPVRCPNNRRRQRLWGASPATQE